MSATKESAAKHTPGPWKMHPPSSVVGSLISWGDLAKGENVCAVIPQKDRDQCAANARLIAAAPALLEALEKLTGLVRDVHNVYRMDAAEWIVKQPIFTEAEAVIRQAKGE